MKEFKFRVGIINHSIINIKAENFAEAMAKIKNNRDYVTHSYIYEGDKFKGGE